MTKFKKLFFVFFIMTSLLVGCGSGKSSADLSGSDFQYVMDKGSFIVGVTDFEPLDYKKDGEWVGFDAEMAGLFAKSLGVSVQFLEIEWEEKEKLLNNGTIDCVWNGMTLSEKVQKDMACSIAYLNNAQMIAVPVDNASKLQTVEECMHLLFAVESKSAGEQELKDRNYRYTPVASQMDALESTSSGKTDAAVIDAIMAGALIGQKKQFKNLMCTAAMNREEFGIGLRKNSDIVEKLNDFLRESYNSGVLNEIAEKYGVQNAVIQLE